MPFSPTDCFSFFQLIVLVFHNLAVSYFLVVAPFKPDISLVETKRELTQKLKMWWCVFCSQPVSSVLLCRGRDIKKQHDQRVYEREMQRINLPLAAFSNPTCELVDENTIVIIAEHEITPGQEGLEGMGGMEGGDPLMGQQVGTPGAWGGVWSSNGTVICNFGPKTLLSPSFSFSASLSNFCFFKKEEGIGLCSKDFKLNAVSFVSFSLWVLFKRSWHTMDTIFTTRSHQGQSVVNEKVFNIHIWYIWWSRREGHGLPP